MTAFKMDNGAQAHRRGHSGVMGIVVAIVFAVLVVALLASLFYVWGPVQGQYYYPRPFYGFLFFPFGLLVFVFLVFLAMRLALGPWRGYHRRWREWGDANEILRRRYARGEITKEQFEQMRRDLEQSP